VTTPNFVVHPTGEIRGTAAAPSTSARITGNGTITNYGVIALTDVAPTVTHNNFPIHFHGSSGEPVVHRLYAPSFESGYRDIPVVESGFEWNSQADGGGHRLIFPSAVVPTFFAAEDHATNTGAQIIDMYQVASDAGNYYLDLATSAASVEAGQS